MSDVVFHRVISKPQERWASDPLTIDNRRDVLTWVREWGGDGALTPDGYEVGIILHNPMHGELDVRYGDRVMYNERLGGDFYPNAPESFEAGWVEAAVTADTTESVVYFHGGVTFTGDDESSA